MANEVYFKNSKKLNLLVLMKLDLATELICLIYLS